MIDVFDADGVAVRMPTKREVCPACDGRGTQDCWEGGMTADEFYEEGPEFAEDYRSGVYMVPCRECGGRNVVEVFDREAATPEQRDMYDEAVVLHLLEVGR